MDDQITDLEKKLKLLENENKRLNNTVLKIQKRMDTQMNDTEVLYGRTMIYEMVAKHKNMVDRLEQLLAERSRISPVTKSQADKVEERTGFHGNHFNDSDKENNRLQKANFSKSLNDCIQLTDKMCSLKSRTKKILTELADAQYQLFRSKDNERCSREYVENLTKFNLQNRVEADLGQITDHLSAKLKYIDLKITDQQEKVNMVQSKIYRVMKAAKMDTVWNSKCSNEQQTQHEQLQIEVELATAKEEYLRVKVATLEEKFEVQKRKLWQQTNSQHSVQNDDRTILSQRRGNDNDGRQRYSRVLQGSGNNDKRRQKLSILQGSGDNNDQQRIMSILHVNDDNDDRQRNSRILQGSGKNDNRLWNSCILEGSGNNDDQQRNSWMYHDRLTAVSVVSSTS